MLLHEIQGMPSHASSRIIGRDCPFVKKDSFSILTDISKKNIGKSAFVKFHAFICHSVKKICLSKNLSVRLQTFIFTNRRIVRRI